MELVELPFQFHHGAIKSSFACLTSSLLSYFNSIMVRLKGGIHAIASETTTFQFHHGAIKSLGGDSYGTPIVNFNSIMVRLKV